MSCPGYQVGDLIGQGPGRGEAIVDGGMRGGGPHMLACAALLPDLLTAAASLASLAPLDAEGLDWFACLEG